MVRKLPRLSGWVVISGIMLVGLFFISPQQVDVTFYKLALICIAAVVGYWLDRSLFPYARPDGYLKRNWHYGTEAREDEADYKIVEGYELAFIAATVRRALIVLAVIIGMGLGL